MSANLEAVRVFFDQWAIYRKVIDHNYMSHREGIESLGALLRESPSGFSFLDLACGDADATTALLATLPVTAYEGVDLSPVALELAKKNGTRLACPVAFHCGEFLAALEAEREAKDVIYIGFSLHHFAGDDKRAVFAAARRTLRPGGAFVFFEPYLRPGETREETIARFLGHVREKWTALTPGEVQAVEDHVSRYDFPETIGRFEDLAAEAGFASARVLFRDDFYAMIACR